MRRELLGAAAVASLWAQALDWRGFPDPAEAALACAVCGAALVALFCAALEEAVRW